MGEQCRKFGTAFFIPFTVFLRCFYGNVVFDFTFNR